MTDGTAGGTGKTTRLRRTALVVGALLTVAEAVAVAVRRGGLFQANTVVRCREGHLFTTYWIPGASLKAVRLGWWRWQRCPVGHHWSVVTPVRPSTLSDEEQEQARQTHDLRVP